MITRSGILDALNLSVQGAFPARMIYRGTLPNEFERPSLLIALDKRTVKDGTDGPWRLRNHSVCGQSGCYLYQGRLIQIRHSRMPL